MSTRTNPFGTGQGKYPVYSAPLKVRAFVRRAAYVDLGRSGVTDEGRGGSP